MRPLTFGSIFAGVGGFDLGFHQAGFRCLWACELDEAAAGVFAYHHPGVPLYADVTKLETPDVIIYGFPCTDLSVAGKRAGLDPVKQADPPRYRQIGNGVVANVSKWLAHQAKKVLNSTPPPQSQQNPP